MSGKRPPIGLSVAARALPALSRGIFLARRLASTESPAAEPNRMAPGGGARRNVLFITSDQQR